MTLATMIRENWSAVFGWFKTVWATQDAFIIVSFMDHVISDQSYRTHGDELPTQVFEFFPITVKYGVPTEWRVFDNKSLAISFVFFWDNYRYLKKKISK